MKTRNQKDLEKHWADKAKKAAKPTTLPKKKSRGAVNQAVSSTAGEATEKD